ncbi:hypothetical protein ACSQ67_015777 [Phaseolus vulgaris]
MCEFCNSVTVLNREPPNLSIVRHININFSVCMQVFKRKTEQPTGYEEDLNVPEEIEQFEEICVLGNRLETTSIRCSIRSFRSDFEDPLLKRFRLYDGLCRAKNGAVLRNVL